MQTNFALVKIIFLLLTFYILQGVIIGFIYAIPLYLDSHGAKWQEQGTFNFVSYPFNLKLLWAPIVDTIYVSRFGRRKTWLIPVQLLLFIVLLILSFYLIILIDQLKVKLLTSVLFFVYFLLATQDICVDGWALTLLANYNLQWASTCQTVGQTFGRFIGFTILMTFESATYTNRFIRKPLFLQEQSYGLFTLNQFIRFWAVTFIIVSFYVLLFKREQQTQRCFNLCEAYCLIYRLLRKKCIQQLMLLFLISPIGYAATYAMTNVVLTKHGVPKETLGLLGIPLTFVKVLVPFLVTQTQHPLTWYNRSYLPRLGMCLVIAAYIGLTKDLLEQWYFYPILISLLMFNEALISLMLVSRVGFYARISDPCIGGTYVTLLSMIGNLGASLTSSFILYVADFIKPERRAYSILVIICFVLGCLWFLIQYKMTARLQALPIEEWHLLPIIEPSNNRNEETQDICLNDNAEQRRNILDNTLVASDIHIDSLSEKCTSLPSII